MRSDIIPGGIFPDYALPDHTGTVRTLSELQGRDHQRPYNRRSHWSGHVTVLTHQDNE